MPTGIKLLTKLGPLDFTGSARKTKKDQDEGPPSHRMVLASIIDGVGGAGGSSGAAVKGGTTTDDNREKIGEDEMDKIS